MKARVIVTLDCNRGCVQCVHKMDDFKNPKQIFNVDELLKYDEIIIGGGEPMLIPQKVYAFVEMLKLKKKYTGKIFFYTSLFSKDKWVFYQSIMTLVDGLTYTVHAEATDKDIFELKQFSENNSLKQFKEKSFRLFLDNRLYEKYDFSNIDLTNWTVIRRINWQERLTLPSNEKLFLYKL